MATYVAIHRNTGKRRDGCYDGFSATGIGGISAQGAKGDAYLVFGIVPFGGVFHSMPHQIEVKSLTAYKFIDHHIAYGLFLDLIGAHIYIESTAIVAFLNRFQGIFVFGQYFTLHCVSPYTSTISKASAGQVFTHAPQAIHLKGLCFPKAVRMELVGHTATHIRQPIQRLRERSTTPCLFTVSASVGHTATQA